MMKNQIFRNSTTPTSYDARFFKRAYPVQPRDMVIEDTHNKLSETIREVTDLYAAHAAAVHKAERLIARLEELDAEPRVLKEALDLVR